MFSGGKNVSFELVADASILSKEEPPFCDVARGIIDTHPLETNIILKDHCNDYFWILATSTQCLKSMHHWYCIYCSSVVQLEFRPSRWQYRARVLEIPEGVGIGSIMRVRARSNTSEKPLPAMVLPAGTTVHSNTCMELETWLFIPGMNDLQTGCMKCQQRKRTPT